MRAMTIRISDDAYEFLKEMEDLDGIPPAIRARATLLQQIAYEKEQRAPKDSVSQALEKMGTGSTRKTPNARRSPNAKRKK